MLDPNKFDSILDSIKYTSIDLSRKGLWEMSPSQAKALSEAIEKSNATLLLLDSNRFGEWPTENQTVFLEGLSKSPVKTLSMQDNQLHLLTVKTITQLMAAVSNAKITELDLVHNGLGLWDPSRQDDETEDASRVVAFIEGINASSLESLNLSDNHIFRNWLKVGDHGDYKLKSQSLRKIDLSKNGFSQSISIAKFFNDIECPNLSELTLCSRPCSSSTTNYPSNYPHLDTLSNSRTEYFNIYPKPKVALGEILKRTQIKSFGDSYEAHLIMIEALIHDKPQIKESDPFKALLSELKNIYNLSVIQNSHQIIFEDHGKDTADLIEQKIPLYKKTARLLATTLRENTQANRDILTDHANSLTASNRYSALGYLILGTLVVLAAITMAVLSVGIAATPAIGVLGIFLAGDGAYNFFKSRRSPLHQTLNILNQEAPLSTHEELPKATPTLQT